MLKRMVVPLAFFILFASVSFSANRATIPVPVTYYYAMLPAAYNTGSADYSVYLNVWERMYEPAAPAVIVSDDSRYYRPPFTEKRYVRVIEKQEPVYNHIPDLTKPVVTGKTKIGVMPHGYLEYNAYSTAQTKQPIRDFRAELWQNETNTASLNESYEHSLVHYDASE
jgi:hypothetical protein